MIVEAVCGACGYRESGLGLGATHAEIAQHDVCTRELFRAPCCGVVVSAVVEMGQPRPSPPCPGCETALVLSEDLRYRVARLSGDVWDGHRCPRCAEASLRFEQGEGFR